MMIVKGLLLGAGAFVAIVTIVRHHNGQLLYILALIVAVLTAVAVSLSDEGKPALKAGLTAPAGASDNPRPPD